MDTVEREAMAAAGDPILARMLAEERVEAEQVDSGLLLRLAGYLRPHRTLATLALVLAFVEALVMTLPAYLVGLAVDAASPTGARSATAAERAWAAAAAAAGATTPVGVVTFFALAVLALWILRWGIAVASQFTVQKLGQYIVHDLRVDTYRHITSMDQGWLQRNPVGRLVNRSTFDVQALSELFSDAFAEGMRDTLFLAVLFAAMISLDPVLGAMLAGALPLLVGIALVYRAAARPAMRTNSAVQSRMNAWIAENLAGMRENLLFVRTARRRGEFEALTRAHQASMRRTIQAWGLVRPALMVTSAIFTAALMGIGARRVVGGVITLGVLTTFLQYVVKLWVPVRNLAEKFNLIQTSLTSGERIVDILDAKPAMVDRPDADAAARVTRGHVVFEDVHFRYPGRGEEVLRGVSFDAPPGSMLALVGDTGAGKSTLIHLLSRFYDTTSGRVVVDGRDVRDYLRANLRGGTALVPQDVVVFAGSVRDNLTLGDPVPDEQVWEALRAVRADGIVARLAGGLDHELEENGRTLSVGERQLLSFARALVRNPPILVLDEATANVDTETEAQIQQALETLTAGRTSVVVAHRLSTIRRADEILVLRHGVVVERGRHAELLALAGEYARLYRQHTGQVVEQG